MVAGSGPELTRASEFRQRPGAVAAGSVFLLDTIGALASIYGLATFAFVGGAWCRRAGIIRSSRRSLAVPVVMGPSFENFREVVEGMRANDAIRIVSPVMVTVMLVAMLQNPGDAQALGERGRMVFEEQAGATARTVQALTALLQERAVSGTTTTRRPLLLPLAPLYGATLAMKRRLFQWGMVEEAEAEEPRDQRRKRVGGWRGKDADCADAGKDTSPSRLCSADPDAGV